MKTETLRDFFGEGKIVVARGKDGSAILGYYKGKGMPVTISVHRDDVPKLRDFLADSSSVKKNPEKVSEFPKSRH